MTSADKKNVVREQRWYFGGLAASGATCITHPLDTIKVVLQTTSKRTSIFNATRKIIRSTGVLGLYRGVSAAVFRQLLSSGTRFGVYVKLGEELKKKNKHKNKLWVIASAAVAGTCAGFLSTPGDVVNVRMQTDTKLPLEQRRNYKNVFHGLYRIVKDEGVFTLYKGATLVIIRSITMTSSVFVMYDVAKDFLLSTPYFVNDAKTHFTASSVAGMFGTVLTQPIDVLKTRTMNAKPGEYKGLLDVVLKAVQSGPLTFFKGVIPSGVRIIPQTILTFLILEQMTIHFGYIQ